MNFKINLTLSVLGPFLLLGFSTIRLTHAQNAVGPSSTIQSLPLLNNETRLKDLMTINGVRENAILGYGLIIGLNGTGDSGGEITNSSLLRLLQKVGLNPKQEVSSKNIAAVIVTAKLPPFARVGQKIDVHISSIGDAGSLAGGTLLVTPLKAGDGQIYAIATGEVSIGGLQNGAKFATSALIAGGAIVEKENEYDFDKKKFLRFSLSYPDFTTAARVERVINENLGGRYAIAKDSTTIDLIIPENYQRRVIPLVALIENFKVIRDQSAKIVINERTGTVVAGGDIKLKAVAIAHGNLTVTVGGGNDGASGENSETTTDKKSRPSSLYYQENMATLKDLVKGLNALGVKPEDLISIFQTLKRNGALDAEIEFL